MSTLNAIMKQSVIPFNYRKEEEHIYKVNLQHTVTVNILLGGNPQVYSKKRIGVLIIAEDNNLEVLIRLGISILEIYERDLLFLTVKMIYMEFRKCLSDIVLDTCDTLLVLVAIHTRDNFLFLINNLIGHFTNLTEYADQKRYMDTFKKPFKLSVHNLSNCLVIINKYTQYLPGSVRNLVYGDNTMNYTLFNIILSQWQLVFAGSAHIELSDLNYILQQLT